MPGHSVVAFPLMKIAISWMRVLARKKMAPAMVVHTMKTMATARMVRTASRMAPQKKAVHTKKVVLARWRVRKRGWPVARRSVRTTAVEGED